MVIRRGYVHPVPRGKCYVAPRSFAAGQRLLRTLMNVILGGAALVPKMLKHVSEPADGSGESNNIAISRTVSQYPPMIQVCSVSGRVPGVGIDVNHALRRHPEGLVRDTRT